MWIESVGDASMWASNSSLRSEDATAKLICFVQWEDLKRKVRSPWDLWRWSTSRSAALSLAKTNNDNMVYRCDLVDVYSRWCHWMDDTLQVQYHLSRCEMQCVYYAHSNYTHALFCWVCGSVGIFVRDVSVCSYKVIILLLGCSGNE